ncbi:AfsR/SARP family transcriptional regulator [Rhodococcus koreensis]|uniref:AfsR/SARP family transcriptional regulator n=1 Tax=Rhodococcus koreensis TaxID=99653 RepID=UPI0036DC46BA
MTVCDIALLGGFAVRVDGRSVPDHQWRHTRAAELVKMLALADRRRMNRERVIDQLWPDLDPAAGAANLRKAIHFARRALGSPNALESRNDMIALFPNGTVVVDAEVFETGARRALAARAGYGVADSYAGDLLPEDRYASWAEEPRDRLRALRLELLKSAGLWHRVLAIDPTDEQAHRGLMRSALEAGDRAAVVRQFELLRRHLRADLGVGPDRTSIGLYEKALAMGTATTTPTARELTQSLLARALVQLNSGDHGACERTAQRARSLAIESGLGREMGEASAVLGILANMRGSWPELFRAEFADSVRRDPEMAGHVLDAHLCLAEFSLYSAAGHEWIGEYAESLRSTAQTADSIQGRAMAELLLGESALFSARLGEARSRLAAAAALYEQGGTVSGHVLSRLRLAEAMLASGERSAAVGELKGVLPLAEKGWLEPHLVVRTYAILVEAAGAGPSAVRQVERADRALVGRNVCPPCSLGYLVAAAKAFANTGHHDQARRRLTEAERLAGMWPGGAWQAAVWEARGALRRASGDLERAHSFYLEAADRFDEVGRPLDRDRCRSQAASVTIPEQPR